MCRAAFNLTLVSTDEDTPSFELTAPQPTRGDRAMRSRISDSLFNKVTPGEMISHYEIIRRIDAGGMGVVYRARDTKLARDVALKLVHHRALTPRSRRRLTREAQILAKLNHANIVQVYEVGEHEGDVFVAMELVEGSTLLRWQSETRRSLAELLAVYRAAADGLAAAHRAGVIHRDFKPNNVLVGNDGRVRVADFGLAVDAGEPDTSHTPQQPSDEPNTDLLVAGTPGYIAPELLGGGLASARCDQYAFCVSLWEAVTGQRPGQPTTARVRPWWLRRTIARGLSADPDKRWPDMDSLRASLDRRGRRLVWLAGSLLAAGVGGGLTLGWMLTPTVESELCPDPGPRFDDVWSVERRAALREHLIGFGKPWIAELTFPLETAIAAQRAAWVETRSELCQTTVINKTRSETSFDRGNACLDDRLQRIELLLGLIEQADEQGLVRLDRQLAELGDPRECGQADALAELDERRRRPELEPHYRELDKLRLAVAGGDYRETPAQAEALAERSVELDAPHLRAEVLELLGRIGHARLDPRLAVDANVQALLAAERAGDDELRFRAYRRLVSGYTQLQDDVEEARRAYEFADATFDRLGARPELQVLLLEAEAELAAAEGEPKLALRQLDAARKLAEQIDPNHPRVDSLRLSLANHLADDRQSKVAIELYGDIARDRRRRLGSQHPDVARVEFNLGLTYLEVGNIEQAKSHLEIALSIQELAYGDDSPVLAPTLAKLAEILLAVNDPQGALALGRRAHAIELAALPVDEPARINGARVMAHAHIAQAQFEEALAVDEAALGLIDGSLIELRAGLEHELGWLLCRLGQHERAAGYLERARLNGDAEIRRQAALSLVDVELSRGHAERALAQLDGLEPAAAGEWPEYTAQYRWLRARALLGVHGRSAEVDELIAAARVTYQELARPDIMASLDEIAAR